MMQLAGKQHLFLQRLNGGNIARNLGWKQFHRYLLSKMGVSGEIDHSHPTAPQQLHKDIASRQRFSFLRRSYKGVKRAAGGAYPVNQFTTTTRADLFHLRSLRISTSRGRATLAF